MSNRDRARKRQGKKQRRLKVEKRNRRLAQKAILPRVKQLLVDKDTRIPGIPEFWRTECLDKARLLSAHEMESYLSEQLEPLAKACLALVRRGRTAMEVASQIECYESLNDVRISLDASATSIAILLDASSNASDPLQALFFAACLLTAPILWSTYAPEIRGYDRLQFAHQLILTGAYSEAVDFLHGYTNIKTNDYLRPGLLKQKINAAEFTDRMPSSSIRSAVVSTLADAHKRSSQEGIVAAVQLIEAYLHIGPKSYRSAPELRDKIDLILGAQPSDGHLEDVASMLTVLADAIRTSPHRSAQDGAVLLESFAKIDPSDYATREAMRRRLRGKNFLARLPPGAEQVNLLAKLASCLSNANSRGAREAVVLLESYLGVTADRQEEAGRVVDSLLQRSGLKAAEYPQVIEEFVATFAHSLVKIQGDSNARFAVAILESLLNIQEGDYFDGKQCVLAKKLSAPLDDTRSLDPTCRVDTVTGLAMAIGNAGACGPRSAVTLLFALLSMEGLGRGLNESEADNVDQNYFGTREDACQTLLQPAALLADFLCEAHPEAAIEFIAGAFDVPVAYSGNLSQVAAAVNSDTGRTLMPHLTIRFQLLITLAEAFVRSAQPRIEDARTVLDAIASLPEASFFGEDADSILDANVQLNFGLAYLRCLKGADEKALLICRAMITYVQRLRENELPSPQHRIDFLCQLSAVWPRLQAVALEQIEHQRQQGNEKRARLLERELMVWAEGIKNRILVERIFASGASALDAVELLTDWPKWTRDQEAEPEASVSDGALSVALGCFGVQEEAEESWQPRQQAAAGRLDREQLLQGAESLEELVLKGALYLRMLFENEEPESRLFWWAWKRDGSGSLQRVGFGQSNEGARGRLDAAIDKFAKKERSRFQEPSITKKQFVQLSKQEQQVLVKYFRAKPKRYASAFDYLAKALNREVDVTGIEADEEDIVFHAEGSLLSLPLAWLRAAEGALWEVARSTSSVVSLTLNQVASRLEKPAAENALCIHWEKASDEGSKGALRVMEQIRSNIHDNLGDWSLWSLGAKPKREESEELATVANVRAALDGTRPFRLVVITAHGYPNAGIRLADGRWLGDGVNLESADILFLASCSVGSLAERSATELEGFYAELAAQRCRTVVAASWQIETTTTGKFVTDFTRRYAKASREAEAGRLEPFAKARLFAETRRELLSSVSPVCVPSIAAFDLYGVG